MGISDRINGWVDNRRDAWGDALGNFLLGTISKGVTKFTEDLEPGIIDQVKESVQQVIDNPATPPETKRMLEKSIQEGNIFHVVMGWVLTVLGLLPALFGLGRPLGNVFNHAQELNMRSQILTLEQVIAIWLRDKPNNEKWFEDLKYFGFDDERIEVIKELGKILPPLADMVRFADFSAFDPEVIEKWREFYDAPDWISQPMSLLGITNEEPRDWANKYWFSHFVQPGRFELGEMYRRGLLGKPLVGQDEVGGGSTEGEAEDTIKLAYKTMGYSSFWQDRLLELVREVPTRVDVRRWWDMRTIDEAELRSIYQRQGYFGKDLENYITWTKVYTDFPVLLARWKNGWITEDEIRARVLELGMPAERVEHMIQEKIRPEVQKDVAEALELTKTETYKGILAGKITRDEGVEIIMRLGKNRTTAEFLVDLNTEVMAGSPQNYIEFMDLAEKYRSAAGREARIVPEKLKAAAAEVVKLTRDVEALQEALKEEEKGLINIEELPEEATKRRDEIRVSLHRAEAELQRAQTDYNALLAEWRHSEE